MPLVRYLTHPQVHIAPARDVRRWSLNEIGQDRVALLAASGALNGTTRVLSSDENKAVETASPLAAALDRSVEVWGRMGENDRSATGYLPEAEFEATADAFFAHPDASVRGWEMARAAQARILAEVNTALELRCDGDVLIVGHGAVGTLLWCALSGVEISRAHDQGPGGGGNWFAFDLKARKPFSGWQPMEALYALDDASAVRRHVNHAAH